MARQRPAILSTLLYDAFPTTGQVQSIDCGAAGGSLRFWKPIAEHVRTHGFDPDSTECDRLNRRARERGLDETYYPYCLAESEETGRVFFRTRDPGSNSLFPPLEAQLARWVTSFPTSTPSIEIAGKAGIEKIDTVSLDGWARRSGISDVDFVKLDVQGAELEILRGGEQLLRRALGFLVEVWFTPVYQGAPLFAEIDAHLRERGFTLFGLQTGATSQFVGRVDSPVRFEEVGSPEAQRLAGQLISADALYLLDAPASARDLPFEKACRLACLAEVCGQIEYAFELIRWLERRVRAAGESSQAAKLAVVRESAHEACRRYDAPGARLGRWLRATPRRSRRWIRARVGNPGRR